MRPSSIRRMVSSSQATSSSRYNFDTAAASGRASAGGFRRFEDISRVPGIELLRPHLPLPRRRDVEHLAILRDRAPGDRITDLLEFLHQVLVGERVSLVFLADDFEELLLDRLPG